MSRSPIRLTAPPNRAFTLVELLAVLVILGIVAAIAIPTYRAVIDNAQWRALEADAHALERGLRIVALSQPEGASPRDGDLLDRYLTTDWDWPADTVAVGEGTTTFVTYEDGQTASDATVHPRHTIAGEHIHAIQLVAPADATKGVCLLLPADPAQTSASWRGSCLDDDLDVDAAVTGDLSGFSPPGYTAPPAADPPATEEPGDEHGEEPGDGPGEEPSEPEEPGEGPEGPEEPGPLDAPAELTATAGFYAAELDWQPVADATSYELTDHDGTVLYTGTATAHTVTDLTIGSHTFHVRASDGERTSEPASVTVTVQTPPNLIVNGGFETGSLAPHNFNNGGGGASYWEANASGSSRSGNYRLRFVIDNLTSPATFAFNGPSVGEPSVHAAAAEGQRHTATIWAAKGNGAANPFNASIDYRSADGSLTGRTYLEPVEVTTPSGTWTAHTFTSDVAPAGTTHVVLRVMVLAEGRSVNLVFDDVELRRTQ